MKKPNGTKKSKVEEVVKPPDKVALHKCRNGHIVEMVPDSIKLVLTTGLNGKPLAAYVTESLCPMCIVGALNHIAATALYSGPAELPVEAAPKGQEEEQEQEQEQEEGQDDDITPDTIIPPDEAPAAE